MRKLLFLLPLLAGLIVPLQASVDFYSYLRNVQIQRKWLNDSVDYYDTTITYTQRKLGPVQLEISEISVIPRGSYLDIVEDAWISGNVNETNIQNLTEDYYIKGTLPVPGKAAVTGLLTWKGDTCYKSTLQPSKYNFDASYLDSITLRQALDSKIALLQQHTETTYEVTFARITLGERKHVRIRYLLPNTGSGAATYAIPVLFHSPATKPPRFVQMTVHANNSDLSYAVHTPSGDMPVLDTATVSVPYAPQVTLNYWPQLTSTMHLTTFDEGPMKGRYLLLNTEVTDSLLARLSKPIQTMFIWRWNAPQTFIDYSNQMKTLSGDAYSAIDQALAVKSAVRTLQKRGYRCGLIHSIEGDSTLAFQSRAIDENSGQAIIDYLSKFDEQYLFSKYSNAPDPLPVWVPRQVTAEALIEKARSDFLSQISYSVKLLRDFADYRHIVVLSTGNPPAPYSKNIQDTLTQLLDSATVDLYDAVWRGVDMRESIPAETKQKLKPYLGFYFPMFFPATVQLSVANGPNPYLFPLDGIKPGSFAVTIRAADQWDTVFNWKGFASDGEITATYSSRPMIFTPENDSGLAKVWAKDESHLTEIEEIYPGGTFGIVTKATYLQATINDISPAVARGVPFLQDEEIHVQRTGIIAAKKRCAAAGISARYARGVLLITAPVPLSRIEFYDLTGRKIGVVSLDRFAWGQGSFRIALNTLGFLKARKMVVMKIIGGSVQKIMKLNLEVSR
jgi:hypothetical protein